MPMFGSRLPKRVTVDPSCNGLSAAFNPQMQDAALKLLRASLDPSNPAGRAEWGQIIAQPILGGSPWIGHPFSEEKTHEISGDRIARERPSAIGNLLTGYWPQSILLHTHPNPNDPGAVSAGDRNLGMPVIAIDTKGRMTCAF